MKQKQYIILLITFFIATSCGVKGPLTEPENFEKFHKKFYRDSIFHYNRINYPLKVYEFYGHIKEDPEGGNANREFHNAFTRKTLPRTVRSMDEYPDYYKMMVDTNNNKMVEKIYIPHSSYIEKRFFLKKKNRWYLDSIQIIE
ncbi:hypothetical protein L21SP5_01676 [Salinivirga cyanobacteriivorans]|uniref:DUF4348 domain-containing protein n=1 Tax=Salinivirga cyanobacteriivorans TaxID=1307839 RepID=A0A0S2HZ04_9BACT|nr:hypothetical protein [Salinivirga cyanobacteriivorans]ALO15319.1 hypothetical protein L21SP5_01676 [Salinivirga cyanobacteriivorans]